MERSGSTVEALDASDLARLYDVDGPVATVYLTTEAALPQAAQRSEAHWRAVREELSGAGADAATLDAIAELVPDAHHEGRCLAVVAAGGRVLHAEYLQEPPDRDAWRWAPLPAVGPMLSARQLTVPHVVVTADRTGADVVAVTADDEVIAREAGGASDPISQVHAGGWSQRRYQERAENTWERNAEDVVATVVRLVDAIGARLVVLAGDVRAVQLIRQELPAEVAARVREIEGGRAAGVDTDEMAAEIARLAHGVASAETAELLRKLREELGQADRAVEGVEATLLALSKSQVDVLAVADDWEDAREAWYVEGAAVPVGVRPDDLTGGDGHARQARLVDVAVRAALGTGARVRVVPGHGGPAEGIGALLRWSD